MGFVASFLFGFIPVLIFAYILYWLDRYEKEPVILLGLVFSWGAIVAAGAAFLVNTFLGIGVYMFTGSEAATDLTTGSLIAPLVEESLKGLAILLIFILFRHEFDSILDGIIYAGITALGFAATENAFYIYSYGFQQNGWMGLAGMVFVRVILVGWQHPFYTAFTGIGLALARLNRSIWIKLAAPVAGWSLAVFTHAFHNTLADFLQGLPGLAVGTLIDWTGWFLMFIFIIVVTAREGRSMVKYLSDEMQDGVMTPAQYKTACSAWLQMFTRIGAIFTRRYSATSHFYQLCGELMLKKRLFTTVGDENGNQTQIENIRAELVQISPRAAAF